MSFMRTLTLLFTLTAITLCAQNRPAPVLPLQETGFTRIFDGATLKGWEQGRRRPDATASAYLSVIAGLPDEARAILAAA